MATKATLLTKLACVQAEPQHHRLQATNRMLDADPTVSLQLMCRLKSSSMRQSHTMMGQEHALRWHVPPAMTPEAAKLILDALVAMYSY